MASEIRVDKINSLSGVGTVTLSPTGVDIAGITTAATLRATTGIVTSLTAGSLTSLGAVSGTTGTFSAAVSGTTGTFTGDVDIADKIIHTGDTNTAIRFPSDDTISFETNGGERARVTSGGRLGIGENSPDTSLHVKSADNILATFESTDADALIEFKDNSTSDTMIIGCEGGDNLLLRTDAGNIIFNLGNNSEKGRIDSSGRLLLGTTTEGHAAADDLTIATSASTGVTIRSGTSNEGNIYFSDGTSGSGEYAGAISYNHSGNSLNFYANSTNRANIDSSGNLTLSAGNLVIGTSGKGIDFSATSDASGKTSELLDDYEEGTWSPVWSDATSGGTTSVSAQMHGRYTKIGRMVTIHFFTWALPTGPSGSIYLQGLPFTAGEIGEVFGAVQAGYYNDGNTSTYNLGIAISSGNTYGGLQFNNAGNNDTTPASFSGFINSYTNFTGTITYLVA